METQPYIYIKCPNCGTELCVSLKNRIDGTPFVAHCNGDDRIDKKKTCGAHFAVRATIELHVNTYELNLMEAECLK